MVLLLPVAAVFILANKSLGEESKMDTLSRRQLAIRAVLIGLILGAYTGFYGAGGGAFILLALPRYQTGSDHSFRQYQGQ